MNDAQLIESLGGPAKVAKLLRYERGGIQRVHNWLRRGIPARVKLDHPEVFLRSLCGLPCRPAPQPGAVMAQGPECSGSDAASTVCDSGA